MWRAVVLVLMVAGCAGGPSVDALPPGASGADAGVAVPSVEGGVSIDDGAGVPIEETLPADPLGFFRAQYDECSRYAILLARGADDFPRVEEDRFIDAVLVRELLTVTPR